VTVLLLLAVVVLIAVNGFFVSAEFGLVRSRRSSLQDLAEDGNAGARRALALHDDLNEYLSACQFGITLASLGIGFLGEPAIATLFEPLFGSFSHGVKVGISVAIAYIIVTGTHVVLGEQVPKIFSIIHPDRIAILVARPLSIFDKTMKPFIAALNAVSNGILRLLRVDPDAASEEGATPEELRILIGQARAGGKLDAGEAGMLTGVFHLHEQEARQVMTPIPVVVTEDDNRDRVRGIVHSNSLARSLMAEGPNASLDPLVREAVIVPETKPLDDLLADLQRQRSSMAVVVDEYGRVVGIVTVEDIIEEVVGEIDDETDPAGGEIRRLANGDWFVRGHVAVTDLLDYGVELPVDTDAYNSVGGFVFAELGRLPKRGDTITADGYSIRVESVRENRIEAVRIRERRAQQGAVSGGEQRNA
jgi:CBS domain containing-hemolysin-like protein